MSHDLDRFIEAQEGTYMSALGEIARGKKTSHWMWCIFPQLAGLGASPTAQYFALHSLNESRSYINHPILGIRYMECVAALQNLPISDPKAVFGTVDAMKLCSSLTLFSVAAPEQQALTQALEKWFHGAKDRRTLELLSHP